MANRKMNFIKLVYYQSTESNSRGARVGACFTPSDGGTKFNSILTNFIFIFAEELKEATFLRCM